MMAGPVVLFADFGVALFGERRLARLVKVRFSDMMAGPVVLFADFGVALFG